MKEIKKIGSVREYSSNNENSVLLTTNMDNQVILYDSNFNGVVLLSDDDTDNEFNTLKFWVDKFSIGQCGKKSFLFDISGNVIDILPVSFYTRDVNDEKYQKFKTYYQVEENGEVNNAKFDVNTLTYEVLNDTDWMDIGFWGRFHDNYVFQTLNDNKQLKCYNTQTNNLLWEVQIQEIEGIEEDTRGVTAYMSIYDDLLLFSTNSSTVALNRYTGALVWIIETGASFTHAEGDELFIVKLGNTIMLRKAATGELVYSTFMPDLIKESGLKPKDFDEGFVHHSKFEVTDKYYITYLGRYCTLVVLDKKTLEIVHTHKLDAKENFSTCKNIPFWCVPPETSRAGQRPYVNGNRIYQRDSYSNLHILEWEGLNA